MVGRSILIRMALTLCVVAGAIVVFANPGSTAASDVMPFVDCVTYDATGNTLTATFGYVSNNSGDVVVVIGASNFVSPPPTAQGQPTSFQPGTHHEVFNVTIDLGTFTSVSWDLNGTSATATNDPASYCSNQAGPSGPTGPTGATGPEGPAGPQGVPGPAGPIGATGASGALGPQGDIGSPGPAGATGPSGPIGDTGPSGPAGSTGPTGRLVQPVPKVLPGSAAMGRSPATPSLLRCSSR